jgi:hypothetical protein
MEKNLFFKKEIPRSKKEPKMSRVKKLKFNIYKLKNKNKKFEYFKEI